MLKPKLIKTVLEQIFKLKRSEPFLIITDSIKIKLAEEFFIYALNHNHKAKIILMPELEQNGQEPGSEVTKEMLKHKVILIITNKSLSHTKARRKATEKGVRIISAPGITERILNRCVDLDYQELIQFHDKLRPIIAKGKNIQVTTARGTDLKFKIHDTHGLSKHLLKNLKGAFGNLPCGEVDSGVSKANGRLIVDGSFPIIGLIKEPIVLEIKDNLARIISKNKQSKQLKQMLDKAGKNAYKIAEFGIGTNPKAKLSGIVLEDEKVKGTVHFALGNDLSYGGKNNVPIHLDGVIRKPTIIVDKKTIMKNGKFII